MKGRDWREGGREGGMEGKGSPSKIHPPLLLAVRVYLYDEQEEEVAVGHSQELLKEVEGEERNDIVLRSRHHIVLNTKK